MISPMFDEGSLLVDAEGSEYLVLSVYRTGHQYDRHYGYSVLSNGRVIEIDDYHIFQKKLELVTDTTSVDSE